MVVVGRAVVCESAVGTAPANTAIDMTVTKIARNVDERLLCITLVLCESFE